MSSGPDFLRIENLSKSFGALDVVKDLSLGVARGEFVSLLGPSGCGKTTTLRIIAGFMPQSAGQIVLDGERIDAVPSHRRGAVMVFQNYALFPHMTVEENVGFGLRMRKVPQPELRSRVGEALELVQLGSYGKRFPRELSGGQQQRVALARAVVLKPKLLLLDEPLSNLDAKLRKELRAEFVKIHQLAGTTTVFVTHDLEEAFSVSDRVAVMNHGRVEQYDTPVAIFNRPASPFVAEFVGHSNVVAGAVEADAGGRPVVRVGTVAVAAPPGTRPGTTIRMTIPAHLVAVTAGAQAGDACLAMRVEASAFLGTSTHYELEGEGIRLQAEVPARAGTPLFHRADRVFASWRVEDVIVLGKGAS